MNAQNKMKWDWWSFKMKHPDDPGPCAVDTVPFKILLVILYIQILILLYVGSTWSG